MFKSTKKWIAKTILTALTVGSIQFSVLPVSTYAQEAGSPSASPNVTVQASNTLKVNVSDITLNQGKTKQVRLTYGGKAVAGSKATWTTSKASVATVKDGVITAKGKGTAKITAKYSGKSVAINVTVKEVKGLLEAKETKLTVKKGKKETISLTYDDKKLSGSKASWKTSNSSVATVKDGVVTAKGKGTATITATYKGNSVSITVTVDDQSKLEATKTKYSLEVGDEKTVRLKYDGDSLSASKASWSTSKSSVATVKNGKITAKGEGTATITATYKDQKVEIEVTVSKGDKLEADDDSITVKVGKKEKIKIKYNGKTISGKDVDWESSKTSIATVKDGTVTGKKKGTATITAEYKGEKVRIKVKVK